MTVAALTPAVSYAEDGVTLNFPAPFRYLDPSHLVVTRTSGAGVQSTLAYGSQWSATAGATDAGGTVTLAATIAGSTLTIERQTPRSQPTDYVPNDRFPAETHEAALDRSMLVDQEQDVVGNRSVKVPRGQTGPLLDLAGIADGELLRYWGGKLTRLPASPFAGKFYGGDAAGLPVPLSGTGNDAALRTDLALESTNLVGSAAVVTPEQIGITQLSNDNSGALFAALGNLNGRILDGRGRTYKLGSNVFRAILQGVKMRNIWFDISSITTGGASAWVAGTLGTQRSLTADVTPGTSVLAVDSTAGFVADGWARITSNIDIYAPSSNKLGQMVKIKTVDGPAQVTLAEPVLYDFTVAGATKITPVAMGEGDHFENVKFLGADTGIQTGLRLDYRLNAQLTNVSTDLVDYTGLYLHGCVGAKVYGGHFSRLHATGLAYGIAIVGGCYMVTIHGTTGEDLRHLVTVGGSSCTNIRITVTGTHTAECRNAGLDSHSNADYVTFNGNTVAFSSSVSGSVDGIIAQCPNFIANDNTIIGHAGVPSGIRHQMLCANVPKASSEMRGNKFFRFNGSTANGVGFNSVHQGDPAIPMKVDMSNNEMFGSINVGFYIRALSGPLADVVAVGNSNDTPTGAQAMLIRAASTFHIDGGTIVGNILRGGDASTLLLLNDSTGEIRDFTISGNTLIGATYPLFIGNVADMVVNLKIGANNYKPAGGGRPINISVSVNGLTIDRTGLPPASVTGTTYTVAGHDEFLTFDTSGTCTVTLPDPAKHPGRTLYLRNVQAQNIVSASSNVVPINSKTAGTAILGNTIGANTILKSDGTNYVSFAA